MRHIAASLVILLVFILPAQAIYAQPEEVTVGDTTLAVYLRLPQNASPNSGAAAPLVILMPGGSGEQALARDLNNWLGEELALRGWAVAIPVSPNGRSFRGDNNALIRLLIDTLQQRQE